jgi:hypothetical protein
MHGTAELSNISRVRPRELWYSLGGASLAVGTILSALAIGYYSKEQRYSLSSSPPMIEAYICFALTVMLFTFAIAGWAPWLRWQRFPDITVLVQGGGQSVATRQIEDLPPIETFLIIVKVFFINGDHDRNVCIRAAYLRGKTQPDSEWGYWQIFAAPTEPVQYRNPVQVMELPINLGPRAGAGGHLIFELPDFLRAGLAPAPRAEFVVEIHEALTGKIAVFPALVVGGTFKRRQGLIPTTIAERVHGPKSAVPWYSVMGRSGSSKPDRADRADETG